MRNAIQLLNYADMSLRDVLCMIGVIWYIMM